jgi:pyruvate dehydrogenase E2 component (dihydrolipoamide acetyltransferase)
MAAECTVPELGENVESATVVEVFVKPGDVIRVEQAVLSLETDKAEFEMPSNVAGTVSEVLVKPGDEIRVGQAVLRVGAEASAAAPTPPVAAPPAAKAAGAKPAAATKATTKAGAEAEGADSALSTRQPMKSPPATVSTPPPVESAIDVEEAVPARAPNAGRSAPTPSSVPAAPSVRRLARELGVDIAQVRGSGPGGRVSGEDVAAFVRSTVAPAPATAESSVDSLLPDFSRWGPVEVEPMSKVRLRTAEQMTRAWSSIPHVTHHDKADITDLDRLRRQYAARVERAGGKLTMTAVLLKVLGSALRKFPKFNASVDMANHAIVFKKYVHIGVAVDTDKGLLVPVIRDVDKKNIVEISLALRELSEKARSRNIRPDELQGAGFTITNLGGIGGTAFSPLINPPEVAVLGVATARLEPIAVGDTFEPRLLMPLSVSYDHRVIDGADAARFLRWVCEALGEPFVMDLEGE